SWFNNYRIIGYSFLLAIIALLTKWIFFLYKEDKMRKSIHILYQFDSDTAMVYEKMIRSYLTFMKSKRIWRVLERKRNENIKYNAGAYYGIDRVAIKNYSINRKPARFLKT